MLTSLQAAKAATAPNGCASVAAEFRAKLDVA